MRFCYFIVLTMFSEDTQAAVSDSAATRAYHHGLPIGKYPLQTRFCTVGLRTDLERCFKLYQAVLGRVLGKVPAFRSAHFWAVGPRAP